MDTHLGYAVVAVDTSESFTAPSGNLVVIDLEPRATAASLPLAGQPPGCGHGGTPPVLVGNDNRAE